MPGLSCVIATVELTGVEPHPLAEHLWRRHRILVAPIVHADLEGLRVTPSLYTTLEEIDRFSDAMKAVAGRDLPAT